MHARCTYILYCNTYYMHIYFVNCSYQVILKHGPFKWNHVIGHEEFVILQDLISDIKVDKTE